MSESPDLAPGVTAAVDTHAHVHVFTRGHNHLGFASDLRAVINYLDD
jgi:hypothetical protein